MYWVGDPSQQEGIMKYQYLGPQTVAELADGKRVLLCKGSVLLVQILSAQLRALVEKGLLKEIA